ncbi:tRNA (adenosine(37)-N6)-threonylcarbamoyltransferase complex dimerization subunit type 1 TsaB [uncultured Serinicoccus sp.]|uniref:tRNA (adenosine(37)-N6)-threonylcarbamoyltransferase complex dimerization subunit type 1 TsaB n=1 Tax=uncultured Serinicoccus sp. TaxID=735514 RepID=UPI00260CB170|nr:tRNA (adenosine(37)-N6)-threonylcarbamoyltransferase complex dimerization subunit type 1 TsaB [uncultured Serinicoccus sp.]
MLLAIDTATGSVGAALHDGDVVRAEVFRQDVRRHGELLAPAVSDALDEAGLRMSEVTAVVCGVGPGPFTGLRVGVVTALVLALGRGLPAPQGVCSLDALAHAAHLGAAGAPGIPGPELLVATDARRREVYWARYEMTPSGARRVGGPGVGPASSLPEEVRRLPAVGRGGLLYPESLTGQLESAPLDVSPGILADLAVRLREGTHPDSATGLLPPEPLYLRRPDAVETRAR